MMAIFGASAPFPAVITVEVGESELVVLPRGDLSPGWFSFMTTIISGSLSSLSTSKICDGGTVDFGMLECAVGMALGDAVAGFWAISECTDVATVLSLSLSISSGTPVLSGDLEKSLRTLAAAHLTCK